MRITDGTTAVELEREQGILQIRLARAQFREAALQELPAGVTVQEEGESRLLSYPLSEEAQSLVALIQTARSRLERLKLAQKLAPLSTLTNQFELPLLHPENIFLTGETLFVVHFGLRDLMAPMEMTSEDFLRSYQALILNIFNPKNSFESLVTGENTGSDKLAQNVSQCGSVSEVIDVINREAAKETRKVRQRETQVPKGRYRFFKYFGIFAVVVVLAAAWFTYSYYQNNRKQAAIITAQTSFLTDNYAQAQTDLENYALNSLPKSARYVLAVSSVNLSDLSLTQKQAVLNNISPKTDDNTLNYWGDTGRGDFDKALDLAKNLGDTQLTLLAYTNLYETTKLNSTMDGDKKQKLMEEYEKQIDELTKSLGK
ncbi:type VII secretion protein EssB [Lactovum odontotermitis]